MLKLPISLGYAHFFLTKISTVRAIDKRLKEAQWRKYDHHDRWKTIKINSEIGEIVIAQFKEGGSACKLCGEATMSSYLLHDHVWAEAGLGPNDIAHASCVAHALGRPLTPDDFPVCPANDIAVAMMPMATTEL